MWIFTSIALRIDLPRTRSSIWRHLYLSHCSTFERIDTGDVGEEDIFLHPVPDVVQHVGDKVIAAAGAHKPLLPTAENPPRINE
jgi:hypothetical protein